LSTMRPTKCINTSPISSVAIVGHRSKAHFAFLPVLPQTCLQIRRFSSNGTIKHSVGNCVTGGQRRRVTAQAQIDGDSVIFSQVAKKALEVNLNPLWYGVLAEIGAGQEVSRWFFRVGAAAGTIAKSVSAYDMTISDTTYGQADRYVTQDRLKAMLDYEYLQVNLTLRKQRGKETAFFAFADTVTAKAFNRENECHGWLGIKYQDRPQQEVPNQILIHIRMLDDTAQLQQEAVGALGVNLIHGALTCKGVPNKVIGQLLDDLNRWRITVDLIDFSGPAFVGVDNRVAALRLVQKELCDAALFDPSGKLLIPQEHLYKNNVLLLRGRFRPFTLLHNDMLMGAAQQFFCGPDETSLQDTRSGLADRSAEISECVYQEDSTVLLELTTRSMMEGGDLLDWTSNSGIQEGAFIQTIEALSTLGYVVMVSNQGRYFRLANYLASFTQKSIVIAMGIPALRELFKEKVYADLQGGILEGFGRLLKHDLKIYVYPTLIDGKLVTAENLKVDPQVQKLYDYIRERGTILPINEYDTQLLKTGDVSKYVQQSISNGTDEWESLVPVHVRDQIKNLELLGYSKEPRRPSKPHPKSNGTGTPAPETPGQRATAGAA